MIRIAYVINSVEGGGAALPVPSVADVLRGGGAEVTILALTRRDGRAIAPMAAAGLEVRVRDGGERDHAAAVRWLNDEIVALKPTHIWTSLTRATLLGQLVGLRRRIPVVSWQHAAYLKPANRRLLRLMQPLSKLWIGDSEAVTTLTAERLKVPPERLLQWPIFRADPHAPQSAPWRPGEPVRIGSLGRLHPVKGYDVLVDALALLPPGTTPHTVTIVGDGAERAALETRAGDRVKFAGYSDDPRRMLAGLHLYVQPSRSEGLCVAAHEAMQAGLPVIASAVGQLPYSIAQGESGLTVPPGNPRALADALAALLAAPERLGAMGERARRDVLERFGSARFEAAGLAILDRLRGL
ncbi:MAG: group 1 glycosyl transferase [Sphingomonas bacterium]|nr:group 1 glycosyl transferase [Sphingomonas bacterium]